MNGPSDKLSLEPKLSREEIAQAKQLLADKGALRACPACGEVKWQIGLDLVELKTGTNFCFKAVLLSCTNCGYFRLHNINKAGIERS